MRKTEVVVFFPPPTLVVFVSYIPLHVLALTLVGQSSEARLLAWLQV